jgi:hypothetical protein
MLEAILGLVLLAAAALLVWSTLRKDKPATKGGGGTGTGAALTDADGKKEKAQ